MFDPAAAFARLNLLLVLVAQLFAAFPAQPAKPSAAWRAPSTRWPAPCAQPPQTPHRVPRSR
jgi:hypothetical protein